MLDPKPLSDLDKALLIICLILLLACVVSAQVILAT